MVYESFMKTYPLCLLVITLLGFSGWATARVPASPALADYATEANAAYHNLPGSLSAYNSAIRGICQAIQTGATQEFTASLNKLGVSFNPPRIRLPLRRVQIAGSSPGSNVTEAGIPVVLGYETKTATLYPPEGLFVDATAIYDRSAGGARFSLLVGRTTVMLRGHTYTLAASHSAAGDHLKLRAKRFGHSGFGGMIHPFSASRRPQIYLLDPYDPNKIPLLMVHGLQSTPVAFAGLVNSLRADPEIRSKYQVWQFYYASGTPVLVNAAALRDSLAETVHALDPQGHDAATKRIVVVGHSMGGVISHTLVSTSGDRVWRSVFRVSPSELQGDPDAIRELKRVLFFRRNPRVVRVIFMASPHRGSPMADSFVGVAGNWLTRLDPMFDRGFSRLAVANTESMTPEAAAFYKGRFSAVRTLSSKSTALIAVSRLPIEVPFHSVIGQRLPGPKEQGSDGVVPYWSSHLDGAQSEVIVRSGHGVFSKPQAVQEVICILRLASEAKGKNSDVSAPVKRDAPTSL